MSHTQSIHIASGTIVAVHHNVAQNAVRLYQQIGGTVRSVSYWDQTEQTAFTYRKKSGIDIDELLRITDRFGGIDLHRRIRSAEDGYRLAWATGAQLRPASAPRRDSIQRSRQRVVVFVQ